MAHLLGAEALHLSARVRDILSGLLADIPWDAGISTLSGGQRRRVSLARLLAVDHDVLLLDEPTKHLDVEAITWLAGHLKRRWAANAGALLVVTHDCWFLDEVCTATWEVHGRIVEPFEGGYAAYALQRVERDRQAAAIEQRRQNLARKELAWLHRGAPARTSKPKFRIDAANALIATPGQLLERLEFSSAQLSTPVKDLSGGQQRRLQLLLILLDQPNCLILDEPNTQEPYVVRTPPFYRSEGRSRGACRTRAVHRVARLTHPARTSRKAGVR